MDDLGTYLSIALLLALAFALVRGVRRLAAAGRRRVELPVRPPELPLSQPWPGEIWWAMMPFADGSGAKDRPCLVLSVSAHSVVAAQITSKYHPHARDAIALPPGSVDDRLDRPSYLRAAERREVHLSALRRRVGPVCPEVWRRTRSRFL
ncbi:type II toxin-antitoxin system PemK/MazF family toxin [Streptomyces sp. NPDC020965]|uniref:type II toxin-antitoxin system PemK/MazF family toxin n=1 Tax=Streptomyces sp. NPDC020965 TaxID=3365105 RepID=UPI00379325AA